jgi:hypothetical protein
MDRRDLNSLNMMKSVEQFLTTNNLFFVDRPFILDAHEKLKTSITEIESKGQTQATDTQIETTLKNRDRNALTGITLRVVAAMGAVATTNSDIRLKITADVSKTDLNRMRENDYDTKINAIYQAALPFANELASWGVTLADIESLNTSVTDLTHQAPTNRNIQIKTKQATTEIKAKISETSALLHDTLDALLLPYKTLNPTLHGEYVIARTIIHTAATHRRKKDDTPTSDE